VSGAICAAKQDLTQVGWHGLFIQKFRGTLACRGASGVLNRWVEAIKHSRSGIDRPVHLIVGSSIFRKITTEVGFAPVVMLRRRGQLNR